MTGGVTLLIWQWPVCLPGKESVCSWVGETEIFPSLAVTPSPVGVLVKHGVKGTDLSRRKHHIFLVAGCARLVRRWGDTFLISQHARIQADTRALDGMHKKQVTNQSFTAVVLSCGTCLGDKPPKGHGGDKEAQPDLYAQIPTVFPRCSLLFCPNFPSISSSHNKSNYHAMIFLKSINRFLNTLNT